MSALLTWIGFALYALAVAACWKRPQPAALPVLPRKPPRRVEPSPPVEPARASRVDLAALPVGAVIMVGQAVRPVRPAVPCFDCGGPVSEAFCTDVETETAIWCVPCGTVRKHIGEPEARN